MPDRERRLLRRPLAWGAAVAALVLVPKCIACVLASFALAGAAGLELCGATNPSSDAMWGWVAAGGLVFLPALGLVGRRFCVDGGRRSRCAARLANTRETP